MPAIPRPSALAALLLAAAAAAGCLQSGSHAHDLGPAGPWAPAATDDAYTVTHAVVFDDGTARDGPREPAGYVIEFLPVPDGVLDQRRFAPGTWLVEDAGFHLVGFISVHDRTFRFDADGFAHDEGRGDRDAAVARLLGRTGRPEYRDTSLGVPRG